MKEAFARLLRFFIQIFYHLTSPFVPQKNSVILAGHGAKYFNGNIQYLFEYLESSSPGFLYFFYTKNKTVYKELCKKYQGKILYAYHPRTFFRFLQAKILLIATGMDDFFPYHIPRNKKVINLWHGIPIKNIGYFIPGVDTSTFRDFPKVLDAFCVSSQFDGKIMQKAFRINKKTVFISGLPKNDFIRMDHSLFLRQNPIFTKKVILYAPTFRDDEKTPKSLDELFPLNQLQKLLEKQDAHFYIRHHLNSAENDILLDFDRIHSASSALFPDPQPLLYFTDILITDYSGIYFDFLLLDRPIIFYNYDFETYRKKRGFLYDYEENTPGPKIQKKENLLPAIEHYLQHPEKDKAHRLSVRNKFHQFTDGKACERIFQKITELMSWE